MKKKISAEIIADSVSREGNRITSFILTFPRHILAELNTHRALSRNSASSRAIPFKTMVQQCIQDPFIPIAWQIDHKGMQGTEYMDSLESKGATLTWLGARDSAIKEATSLSISGVTKQICNRILEPYMWHTAIVTATDLTNFFALRCPQYKFLGKTYFSKKDIIDSASDFTKHEFDKMTDLDWLKVNDGQGEIHIMELAEQMWDAMKESEPKVIEPGEWHIPFGDRFSESRLDLLFNDSNSRSNILGKSRLQELKIKIATARCARVSYLNYEGTDDYRKDVKLHDRLSKMGHWSPFEHCARAMTQDEYDRNFSCQDNAYSFGRSGNLGGFIQYRKTFSGENIV